jgi:hypothetical protein
MFPCGPRLFPRVQISTSVALVGCHIFSLIMQVCLAYNVILNVFTVIVVSNIMRSVSERTCIPASQFKMVQRNAGRSVQTGNAIYWLVCEQQNAYRPVCSDCECHLLAGLSTTECLPASQFKMVKYNAGRSINNRMHTGQSVYNGEAQCRPVCQQQNAYWPVSLK